MNNLPKNENSKKRKRKSETGNSKKKGKSGNGDSDSPDKNENGDSDSPDKNKNKAKVFFPHQDEETKSFRYYMEKYDTCVRKNELCPRGTRKEVEDRFHSLYSEYKKWKPFNPELE
jgi:cobalamin biosynthesis protein CobT